MARTKECSATPVADEVRESFLAVMNKKALRKRAKIGRRRGQIIFPGSNRRLDVRCTIMEDQKGFFVRWPSGRIKRLKNK